jgi:hypothetical protein
MRIRKHGWPPRRSTSVAAVEVAIQRSEIGTVGWARTTDLLFHRQAL